METISKAIETSGTLDDQNHITLDEPLPELGSKRVRVIVLVPENDDISESEWLRAATNSSAFDFLQEPEEDLYTLEDGKPFHDPR